MEKSVQNTDAINLVSAKKFQALDYIDLNE